MCRLERFPGGSREEAETATYEICIYIRTKMVRCAHTFRQESTEYVAPAAKKNNGKPIRPSFFPSIAMSDLAGAYVRLWIVYPRVYRPLTTGHLKIITRAITSGHTGP